MSGTSSTKKFSLGQRVVIANNEGVIRYVGRTKFSPGNWVGVCLDEPKGKNDGSVQGVRYFQCKPSHGIFAKPVVIKVVKTDTPKKKPKSSKKGGTKEQKRTKKKTSAKSSKDKNKDKKVTSEKLREVEKRLQEANARKKTIDRDVMAESGAIKELESELSQLKLTLEKKESTIAELQEELKEARNKKEKPVATPSKGDNAEIASLKSQIEKLELEKEEAVQTLEAQVEELKIDKELAEEEILGLNQEVEENQQEMEEANRELQVLSNTVTELEADKERLLTNFSPDAQNQLAIIEENNKLKILVNQVNAKWTKDKEEHDTFKDQALEKLTKFKEMEGQIVTLTEDLEGEKEKVKDFQEALDEAGSHEEEIEALNDENLKLESAFEDEKKKVDYLDQMKEANEEIIEQQNEFNTQLQVDLDQKEMEIEELNSQIGLKLKQIEDLHQTQRKFKDHVKHLEAEVMDCRSQMNREEGNQQSENLQFRQTRKANMQLQARVSEVRGKTVDYVRAKIEKEEYASKMRFFQMHIPDNLNVDHTAIELVLVLDRLKGKSVEAANLLAEFYGKETHNETLASCSYDLCDKLLSLAKNINTLRRCIEKCDDDETFAVIVGECKTLTGPEECIDELLSLISRDEFDVNYNKSVIDDAQENIVGFVAAHFMTDENERGNRRLKTMSPLNILLDVKRLTFSQELISTYFQCLSDLFDMVPKVENPGGDPLPNEFEDAFSKMKQLCIGNSEILKQMLNQAQTYQLTCENRSNISGTAFTANIKNCSAAIFGCGVRVKEMLESFNSVFSRAPPDESNRDYFVSQIQSRLEAEASEDRLASRLLSTQGILKELSEKLLNIPEVNTNTPSQKTIPLWEQCAQQVRKELLESANLKNALEQAQTKVEERDRALFKLRKDSQEKQSKIDVLQAGWDTSAGKLAELAERERELDKLRKRVKQQQDSSDEIVKDMNKYQQKNKVLRSKVLKLKVEIKAHKAALQRSGPSGGTGTGISISTGQNLNSLEMATQEINLLVRTISSMRFQLAQARCSIVTRNLNASLPILPVIWGGAHTVESKDSTTEDGNTAVGALKACIPSPFFGDTKNDARLTQTLSHELSALSSRVSNYRATPKLVDISKTGIERKNEEKLVTPGQQWLSRIEEAQKLKNDTADFNKRLQTFLDSKRSHSFRSLFSSLAAPESAALGGGKFGQLVGKVTVPSIIPGGNESVTIDRHHLSQLHNILVN